MHKVIEELLDHGIEMEVRKRDGRIEFEINTGFKSNLSIVPIDEQKILVKDRYGSTEEVEEIQQILRMYLYWFDDAINRWGDRTLESKWLEMCVKYDMIEVEEIPQPPKMKYTRK